MVDSTPTHSVSLHGRLEPLLLMIHLTQPVPLRSIRTVRAYITRYQYTEILPLRSLQSVSMVLTTQPRMHLRRITILGLLVDLRSLQQAPLQSLELHLESPQHLLHLTTTLSLALDQPD
jgi:hypothetical protein